MLKRTAKAVCWLSIISAASRGDILLGLVLYPIAYAFVVLVNLSPFILAFAAWLTWYRHRHGRLPAWVVRLTDRVRRWLSRRMPAWLIRRIPAWPFGITSRRMRRRARRRPRPPAPHEAPTAEMPDLTEHATTHCSTSAGHTAAQRP